MYSGETVTVKIPQMYNPRESVRVINGYRTWLNERNIKFVLVYAPVWNSIPEGLSMRAEDALMFRLAFNL